MELTPIPQPEHPLAYPVYVYEKGKTLPDKGTYYIIAGNGLWLHKDTGLVFATVRAESIGHLDVLIPSLGWRLPALPVSLMLRAVLFLRKVFKKFRAESCLLIFWSKERQEFALVCPSQEVSYGGIAYEPDQKLDGYLQVGSIHSHCDFNAYHSSTDRRDEMDFDGLHITVGHLTDRNFSLAASVVVNGQRAQIDPIGKIEGIVLAETVRSWGWLDGQDVPSGRFRFSLDNTKEELRVIYEADNEFVEKEWLPQVRARTFLGGGSFVNRRQPAAIDSKKDTNLGDWFGGRSGDQPVEIAQTPIEKDPSHVVRQEFADEVPPRKNT